ncbi:MAG TPA: ATP-dependent DNA ligase [Acidimicrobiia bacterium]|nr:ATP-dependent DNA ligase [Acidimicrobiia bacterium]
MEVSNADRVVFPDDGITKGDVVAYYESVAPKMLPFLANRALTVERFPRGTGSKGFMQKNAPEHFTDDVIDRHEVPKEDGGTTVYPVVHDAGAIPAFANLGVITFHVPPSTVDDDWHPDWVIWDLDPPNGAFGLVREAAQAMREVLAGFAIDTILMTSGSNGYHLRARLDPVADAEAVARVARGTSALASAAYPDQMTLAFRKADRGERVFVDWLRNAPYSTSVVPWSIRARPGAPVAVPISWEEIGDIDPNGIEMAEADDRFGLDPWKGLGPIDLTPMVEKVEEALAHAGVELEPFDRFRS